MIGHKCGSPPCRKIVLSLINCLLEILYQPKPLFGHQPDHVVAWNSLEAILLHVCSLGLKEVAHWLPWLQLCLESWTLYSTEVGISINCSESQNVCQVNGSLKKVGKDNFGKRLVANCWALSYPIVNVGNTPCVGWPTEEVCKLLASCIEKITELCQLAGQVTGEVTGIKGGAA